MLLGNELSNDRQRPKRRSIWSKEQREGHVGHRVLAALGPEDRLPRISRVFPWPDVLLQSSFVCCSRAESFKTSTRRPHVAPQVSIKRLGQRKLIKSTTVARQRWWRTLSRPNWFAANFFASDGNRTRDIQVNSLLLYQLSYFNRCGFWNPFAEHEAKTATAESLEPSEPHRSNACLKAGTQ